LGSRTLGVGSESMKMITVDEEVLRQALEFIKVTNARSEFWLVPGSNLNKTVNALKTALEQPENGVALKPVFYAPRRLSNEEVMAVIGPFRREWRGLTEEEIEYPHPPAKPPVYATSQNTKAVRDGFVMGGYEKEPGYYSEKQLDEFARAVEAALKEKNT